jgi:hypothetical protein
MREGWQAHALWENAATRLLQHIRLVNEIFGSNGSNP